MSFTGEEVVETDQFVMFWKPPAVFSQWTRSQFELDSVVYSHAEQYMMAEKARLFGDELMLGKILVEPNPATQKKLGQRIRGFDDATWHKHRVDIVVRGNLAKFAQSEKLRTALCNTGDKTLVEASPFDRIWGIGLRADDPRAQDRATWNGHNLLGQALEEVRRRLRTHPG